MTHNVVGLVGFPRAGLDIVQRDSGQIAELRQRLVSIPNRPDGVHCGKTTRSFIIDLDLKQKYTCANLGISVYSLNFNKVTRAEYLKGRPLNIYLHKKMS